jgi:membrane protein required for colicin V production
MNLLDMLLAGLVVAGALWGLLKGFVRITAMLVTLVVGGIVAARCYAPVAGVVAQVITNPTLQRYVAMTIVFVGFALVVGLLARWITHWVVAVELGWLNRMAGLAAGAALGFATGALLISLLTVWLPENDTLFEASRLYPRWLALLRQAETVLPPNLTAHFNLYYQHIRDGAGRLPR